MERGLGEGQDLANSGEDPWTVDQEDGQEENQEESDHRDTLSPDLLQDHQDLHLYLHLNQFQGLPSGSRSPSGLRSPSRSRTKLRTRSPTSSPVAGPSGVTPVITGQELVSSDCDTFSTGSEKVNEETPLIMEKPFQLPKSSSRWSEEERQKRVFHQLWKKTKEIKVWMKCL